MAKSGARDLKADMTAKADVTPSTFSRDEASAFFHRQWPSLDDASVERLIANALERGEDGAFANRYDRRLSDITTKAAIPEIPFLWDSLTRIQCPTLVMRGEHSPILDEEISSRMVESLPNGRLYVFEDTGHSLPRLRPEEFAGVLKRFLLDEPL
jgi:pimeloyl-ACP methyl ester carboxylesterase